MGRPCTCCADCVSIWSIDSQSGNIRWKKNFGYVYSIAQYGDFLFALVYDTESQVVCLRKENGAKVTDYGFKLHFLSSSSIIWAVDTNNIFISNPTQLNGGNLYRYIEKELTDVYKFNNLNYKFLNGKMIGFGNNTEDYYKYTNIHQNSTGFKINFLEKTNIDNITVNLNIATEEYELDWILDLQGKDERTLISETLQLPDIIDSINIGSDFIELNFHIVPKLEQLTYSETIESDFDINNRIFGTLSNDIVAIEYNDGLGNRLQSMGLKSYSEEQFHGFFSDYQERYGEVFDVFYSTNSQRTIPALIEEFNLTSLTYERYELSSKNDELINLSQQFLHQEFQINEIKQIDISVIGGQAYIPPVFTYNTYDGVRPYEQTKFQITTEFIRDDSKKIDSNRDYSYGQNLVHEDVNGNTRSLIGPYVPTSSPIETYVSYLDINSATTLRYYENQVPIVTDFINSYNNPKGYVKNIFYHTKINDVNFDSKNRKYILNAEYFVHWLYLREEFLGYNYDRATFYDVLDLTIRTEDVLVPNNAMNITPTFVGPTQSHNDVGYYVMNVYFPTQSYVSLQEAFGYVYILNQSSPDSLYTAGHFVVQSSNKEIFTNLQNIYGFNVTVDRITGQEFGVQYQREIMFYKFSEPVLSGFIQPLETSPRMVYTVPVHTNLVTNGEDFTSYTFLDGQRIYPYKDVIVQNDNVNFLESIYNRNMSITGVGMNNKIKYKSYPNQQAKKTQDIYQYELVDSNSYYSLNFDLNEFIDSGLSKQRYSSKADINQEYFKDKTKLSYNDNLDTILYNNSVRLIVGDNNKSYVYYKSLDGNLSTSIDMYHIRYNLSETTVSGLCLLLVFQPVIASQVENGQIKIDLKLTTCQIINGEKTYKIDNIQTNIDLTDGDMTPVLDALNGIATDGIFSFLTTNTNITEDWVMIIFDTNIVVDIFSSGIKNITEQVTITNNDLDNYSVIDGTYYYDRD